MDRFKKVAKYAEKGNSRRKKLCLSIVSLVIALMVLCSATYCWYVLSKGEGEGENINLTVGQGLRVNDLGKAFKNISDNSYLLPASSVDGRNLYFPADGNDFSNVTDKLTFRTANAGDRNYSYVQLDFNLTAEANYTGIYLDKDTSLSINIPDDASSAYRTACQKAQKAVRAAIYYEKMTDPVVFNAQNNPSSVNAVKEVDRTTGRFIESDQQVAVPFKDYSYGKRQLAVLNQGETRPFSLIIWLEGTDENCTSDAVMLKQLVLNLKFTTTWDNKATIKFIDNANALPKLDDNGDIIAGQYISVRECLDNNPQYSLLLNYNDNAKKIDNLKFTMYKSSTDNNNSNDPTKWYCNIPDIAYHDLKFQIVDDSNDRSVVYQWTETPDGASTLNRGTATVYNVDAFDNTETEVDPSPNGHWHDGDIEDNGNGHDVGEIDDDDW